MPWPSYGLVLEIARQDEYRSSLLLGGASLYQRT